MTSWLTAPIGTIDPQARTQAALQGDTAGDAGYWTPTLVSAMAQVAVDLTWPSLEALVDRVQEAPIALPSGWTLVALPLATRADETGMVLRQSGVPGAYAVSYALGTESFNKGEFACLRAMAFQDNGGMPPSFDGHGGKIGDVVRAGFDAETWYAGGVFAIEPSFDPESPYEFRQRPEIRGGRATDGFLDASRILAVLGEALEAAGLAEAASSRAESLLDRRYRHFSKTQPELYEAACGAVAADRGLIGPASQDAIQAYVFGAAALDPQKLLGWEHKVTEMLSSRGANAPEAAYACNDRREKAWIGTWYGDSVIHIDTDGRDYVALLVPGGIWFGAGREVKGARMIGGFDMKDGALTPSRTPTPTNRLVRDLNNVILALDTVHANLVSDLAAALPHP